MSNEAKPTIASARMACLEARWPAPQNVKALTTTRVGGVSSPPFESFNLGLSTGDDRRLVLQNRARLQEQLGLESPPCWLNQAHGNAVASAEAQFGPEMRPPEADACTASTPGLVCAILTADCIPVVICDRRGQHVAAAHAGWRGLDQGVLAATCEKLQPPSHQLIAWLGPAIGATAYEVGEELRDRFMATDRATARYFLPGPRPKPGKFLADIVGLARYQLEALGVSEVFGGEHCTYSDARQFFSFRRDGARTGRMATLIWRET